MSPFSHGELRSIVSVAAEYERTENIAELRVLMGNVGTCAKLYNEIGQKITAEGRMWNELVSPEEAARLR